MTPERNFDDDEIDPDAAPDPVPFEAPKGLRKKKRGEGDGHDAPEAAPVARSSPKDEIDPDAAPEPAPFRAPPGLRRANVRPDEDFEVKPSASNQPPPLPVRPDAPTPPGADVRMDKPLTAGPKSALPHPEDLGPINIRIPVHQGPKPPIPRPEDFGPIDVRMQKAEGPKGPLPKAEDLGPFEVEQQKGAAKLAKLEAPPETFDVIQNTHTPQPKPADKAVAEILEGNVEVKDYRKSEAVDVSGEVPDVFGKRKRIGIVDTTFARFDMGGAAEEELAKLGGDVEVLRRTVPGIKDLAVECKILLEKHGCHIVIACGMVGGAPIDQQCAHEASLGIQWAKLMANKHILEVFVHQKEAKDDRELAWLMDRRTREHAHNAWFMVLEPQKLREMAGTGQRQGFADEGAIRLKK